MIDDRQQEIDTMYADADAAKQKAAELEKEYSDPVSYTHLGRGRFRRRAGGGKLQIFAVDSIDPESWDNHGPCLLYTSRCV